MTRSRAAATASMAWAALGLAIALAGFGSVNSDALGLVTAATVLGVGTALVAASLLARGSERSAGACLVVSAVTPTWFAAWLNLLPLVGGLLLLVGRPSLDEQVPRTRS